MSDRFYRLLLLLCPGEFRDEYGSEMARLFRDRCRREGTLRVLLEALPDLAIAAVREHMETLWKDLRYCVRLMRKSPGFVAVAVTTIGLGIGANTAIFSIVNAVMLRPLPYSDPERLVGIWGIPPSRAGQSFLSPASFLDCKNQGHVLEQTEGLEYETVNLIASAEPVRVGGARVSAGIFSLLGVPPLLGRTFLAEDDRDGAAPVAMLSYRLWQQQFGSDPQAVGRSVTLNGRVHTVIGITPPILQYPLNGPEVWTPLAMSAKESQVRHTSNFQVFARLKPGVSAAQAQAELTAMARRDERLYPQYVNWSAKVILLNDQMVADVRKGLLVLFGAVGLVLLIACSNIGNLLLARATVRRREIALRTALGASRSRLVRQLLTESVVLASIGGAAGLVLAKWALKALVLVIPPSVLVRSRGELGIDVHVMAFTLAASLLAALVFGLAPALRTSKLDLNASLKEAGRSAGTGSRDRRLRNALVTSEVALSFLLLIGAGLLMLSFWRLQNVSPGFRTEKLLTFRVALPESKYKDQLVPSGDTFVWSGRQVPTFYDELLERLRSLPGVNAAAASGYAPFTSENNSATFETEETRYMEGKTPPRDVPMAFFRPVSPNYFRTLGIPLLRGRELTARDNEYSPPVAVINETMARRFWPGQNPIGRRFRTSTKFPWRTIVGVVGDVKYRGLGLAAIPEMYFSYPQALWPQHAMTVVLRTSGDPANLAAAARREVLAIDPDLPIYDVRTMEDLVYRSLAGPRFNMLMLEIFAGLALMLAGVGIYGVIGYSVTQRTHELGLRMAMGAQARDVIKLVLREAMILTSIGLAAGLVAALVATRLLSSLLFAVRPTDPGVFVAVSVLLTAVALLASYIPARRATRVDPINALRCE